MAATCFPHDYTPEAMIWIREQLRARGLRDEMIDSLQLSMDQYYSRKDWRELNTFSIYGFGTTLLGHSPVRNGWVTTKWVTALHLPLRPIESYYIRDCKVEDSPIKCIKFRYRPLRSIYLRHLWYFLPFGIIILMLLFIIVVSTIELLMGEGI